MDQLILGGQDFLHLLVVVILELFNFPSVSFLLLSVLGREFSCDHPVEMVVKVDIETT